MLYHSCSSPASESACAGRQQLLSSPLHQRHTRQQQRQRHRAPTQGCRRLLLLPASLPQTAAVMGHLMDPQVRVGVGTASSRASAALRVSWHPVLRVLLQLAWRQRRPLPGSTLIVQPSQCC